MSSRLKETDRLVRQNCDETIQKCLDWLHHAFKVHEKLNSSIMIGIILGEVAPIRHCEYLPGGFRYFANWVVRNAGKVNTKDIKKLFQILNHQSWGAKIAAERSDEFEDELQRIQRSRNTSQVAEDATPASTSTSLLDFEDTLHSLGMGRSDIAPSPSIDDFEDTVVQILT
ncbi:hypothetical protein BT69DRAFT_1287637 [Atractiella rhizophila]|nr:hypothetical protein BT69DRAFT_1287637 [Atractiella rhizophila]